VRSMGARQRGGAVGGPQAVAAQPPANGRLRPRRSATAGILSGLKRGQEQGCAAAAPPGCRRVVWVDQNTDQAGFLTNQVL
jgi:hypothetical protein